MAGTDHLLHPGEVLLHPEKVGRSLGNHEKGNTEGRDTNPNIDVTGIAAKETEHRQTHHDQIESCRHMQQKVALNRENKLVERDLIGKAQGAGDKKSGRVMGCLRVIFHDGLSAPFWQVAVI